MERLLVLVKYSSPIITCVTLDSQSFSVLVYKTPDLSWGLNEVVPKLDT